MVISCSKYNCCWATFIGDIVYIVGIDFLKYILSFISQRQVDMKNYKILTNSVYAFMCAE